MGMQEGRILSGAVDAKECNRLVERVRKRELVPGKPVVAVLFESNEWSDYKIADEIAQTGLNVKMIDMCAEEALETALECNLLVSRVFASSVWRGHQLALRRMDELIVRAQARGIPLLNEGRAHAFEISKAHAARALNEAGIASPRIFACGLPAALARKVAQWEYPCVVKPDCSGRSTHTAILQGPQDALAFLRGLPAETLFLAQQFAKARDNYVSRIEIAGGKIVLAVKRSIAANGLSSYHEGSVYQLYGNCPSEVSAVALAAAETLAFYCGSFDIVETNDGPQIIDANSVSNVSQDCSQIFGGLDLMRLHARAIADFAEKEFAGL